MIISARRSPFPKSNVHLGKFERGTTNAGTLRPVAFFPVVPADDVFFSAHGLVRPLPIKLPFLAGFDIRVDTFFIPYRLYNKSLRDNNVSTFNPDDIQFPRMSFSSIASSTASTSTLVSGSYSYKSVAGYANRNASVSYYTTTSTTSLGTGFPFVMAGSFAQLAGFPVGFMNGNPMTDQGGLSARLNFSALRYLSYVDVFRNYYANLQLDYALMAPAALYRPGTSASGPTYTLPELSGTPVHFGVKCKALDSFIESAYNFSPTPVSSPTANLPHDEFIMSFADASYMEGGQAPVDALRITENLCTRDGGLFLRSFAPFYQESWINKAKYDSGPGSVSVQVEDDQVLLTSIRSGSKILKYKELAVAGGYRYDDFLDVQFDVRTQADTTIPVFLGSSTGSLSSDPLYQLAPGESSASGIGKGLGAIGGVGMGTVAFSPRRWSFHEFGEIMVLLSLVPKVSYFATIDPFLEKSTLNTLYYPALDRLGFQPLMARNATSPWFAFVDYDKTVKKNVPLFYSGMSETDPPVGSFPDTYSRGLGYQPAWSEYTVGVSRVTGDLSTALRPWCLTRQPGIEASGLVDIDTAPSDEALNPAFSQQVGELRTITFLPSRIYDINALSGPGSIGSPIEVSDTYIHPEDYNYLFEDTLPSAHNFIYEISFQCDIRREKSKLNMPTFGL